MFLVNCQFAKVWMSDSGSSNLEVISVGFWDGVRFDPLNTENVVVHPSKEQPSCEPSNGNSINQVRSTMRLSAPQPQLVASIWFSTWHWYLVLRHGPWSSDQSEENNGAAVCSPRRIGLLPCWTWRIRTIEHLSTQAKKNYCMCCLPALIWVPVWKRWNLLLALTFLGVNRVTVWQYDSDAISRQVFTESISITCHLTLQNTSPNRSWKASTACCHCSRLTTGGTVTAHTCKNGPLLMQVWHQCSWRRIGVPVEQTWW